MITEHNVKQQQRSKLLESIKNIKTMKFKLLDSIILNEEELINIRGGLGDGIKCGNNCGLACGTACGATCGSNCGSSCGENCGGKIMPESENTIGQPGRDTPITGGGGKQFLTYMKILESRHKLLYKYSINFMSVFVNNLCL